MKVARGSTRRGANGNEYKCMRRCMVAFDDETFEEIRRLAIDSNTTFAKQVRQLVEVGLEGDLMDSSGIRNTETGGI